MGAKIPGQIGQLQSLSRQKLLELWQKPYGKAAPLGIRREVMVPFVAYRMQENQFGGLKSSTRAELRRIARSLERGSSGELLFRPRIKSGTRLYRRWQRTGSRGAGARLYALGVVPPKGDGRLQ